jgi:hypothetical protein
MGKKHLQLEIKESRDEIIFPKRKVVHVISIVA